MAFGSLFGAIAFGILGPFLGIGFLLSRNPPAMLKGASLIVLGVSVAGGLLIGRPWARWLGVLVGAWFAWIGAGAFLARGSVFPLLVMLASGVAAVFLFVPFTGRVKRDPASSPGPAPRPSTASRVLLGAACAAIAGFVGAFGWAAARTPAPAPIAVGSVPGSPSSPATAGTEPVPAPSPAGGLSWRDFASGIKEAKSGRKLIVADFYATWCGPCKLMEKRTFHDPRVMDRLRDVVPVRVDAEETVDRGGLKGVDLALRYGIEVYPTIVVVDGTGHEVARNTGVMSPDEFLSWLDAVIERAQGGVAAKS
ncbi:MAG TPA: thioredoxin fold domain-containing protein [Candidatus Polarisedimenticolaceae bacterium]|nr:thioredoxin fold domain-containing protein [Candidatus Polarisedimenticolaceae bacterium]